jgi:hypothetical protein
VPPVGAYPPVGGYPYGAPQQAPQQAAPAQK